MMHSMQRTMGNARLSRLWGTTVQAKLTVGAPNDPYEHEADRVATHVASQNTSSAQLGVQRQSEDAEPWQATLPAPSGPQHCPECHKKLQRDPSATLCPSYATTLQRQATSAATPEVTPEIEKQINTSRGNSQTLTDSVRAPMEQRMGADFSGVRVHTDSTADHLTRALQARAFTTGPDIFLRQGEYNPSTRAGQALLAHELTHVVQQGGGQKLAQRAARDFQVRGPFKPRTGDEARWENFAFFDMGQATLEPGQRQKVEDFAQSPSTDCSQSTASLLRQSVQAAAERDIRHSGATSPHRGWRGNLRQAISLPLWK
jgi:hypothetical protein